MKKSVFYFLSVGFGFLMCGQIMDAASRAHERMVYTEASSLTLVGKLFPDTPNPYHRVDTVRYKGFTASENIQVRYSSGIACVFRTDASFISVLTEWGKVGEQTNTNDISAHGYDLYIKKDGQWVFAGAATNVMKNMDKPVSLAREMEPGMKECLLYLPTYSEQYSVKIGVEEGAVIEAAENPFRHRIGVFGSSYTHGSSTGRSGMTWPAQFSRMTGLQLLSLGCSGNSKLQDYFADVLAHAEMDALLLDAFSNPTAEMIEERLFPFIETVQKAHPGMPIIFQRTIYRPNRVFNTLSEKNESAKMAMADSLMRIACKKYKDVWYITPDPVAKDHTATIDGVHPSNYGYTLWAKSIVRPVRRILKRYGIR